MSQGNQLSVTVSINGMLQTTYGPPGQGINWLMTPDQMREHVTMCLKAIAIAESIAKANAAVSAEPVPASEPAP